MNSFLKPTFIVLVANFQGAFYIAHLTQIPKLRNVIKIWKYIWSVDNQSLFLVC